MANCKNCNLEVAQNYCSNCGQPVSIKRIDGHYIIHEIEHVLHLERGILYTIKELLLNPGQSVRKYILESRNRLVKPIIFIIVTSLIYSLISHFFHIEEGYAQLGEAKKTTAGLIGKWIQDHYGYANIFMGMFIALWLKLFFRKYDYNFFEILILLCFVMGMGMLMYALFALVQGITHFNFMTVAGVIALGYSTWAIGQFFDQKKPLSYVKSFASYMLGMIVFWLSAFLLGAVIDLVIKP